MRNSAPTKKQALDLLYNEPYRIGHWVGFRDLTEIHNTWLRDFLYGSEDQTLLAHRGSYKTTVLSLFLALAPIVLPRKNIIFFRKTDDDVTEVIRQSKKIMDTGCVQELAKAVWGRKLILTTDTASAITTGYYDVPQGAEQILGIGIGTSITGKHANIVITDDIVNLTDRISRAEREKTKLRYMELQNICNRDGRFINTGTPWHRDDAITLMKNVSRWDCYQTGLISREKLEIIRHSMSDSLFAANYELKHIADKDALFRNPVFVRDEALLYGGSAHIDASYGGSDYTAYTVINPNTMTAYGKIWQRHVDTCLDEIALLHKRFRAGSISCESNADKGYLCKEIRKQGFPCIPYHEKENKYIKISTELRKQWDKLEWVTESDPEYINQILDYTEHAEHDDAPDSAASLCRALFSHGSSQGSVNRGKWLAGGF